MKLTPVRIEEFAARPNVKKHAVENFLLSLQGMSHQEAVANCMQDARSYRWNHETSGAIREALAEHYAK